MVLLSWCVSLRSWFRVLMSVSNLRFPHKNDVRFTFTSSFFVGRLMSYLRYLLVHSCVHHMLCFVCVLFLSYVPYFTVTTICWPCDACIKPVKWAVRYVCKCYQIFLCFFDFFTGFWNFSYKLMWYKCIFYIFHFINSPEQFVGGLFSSILSLMGSHNALPTTRQKWN